ncbi:MAG: hypothetical protein AB2L18_06330 [Anaerolineaceae bacterium]
MTKNQLINEYIFEIRYKPNSKIIDLRGILTENISKFMGLSEWQITENRIDISNVENDLNIFISFKNAGLVIHNNPNNDFFLDQSIMFINYIFDQEPLITNQILERLGVRFRYLNPVNNSFDNLLKTYQERIVSINPKFKDLVDAQVIDIGNPINLQKNNGFINLYSGPMQEKQIRQFFRFENDVPKVGFYLDIDYWTQPQKKCTSVEINNLINKYSNENWDLHNKILNYLQNK